MPDGLPDIFAAEQGGFEDRVHEMSPNGAGARRHLTGLFRWRCRACGLHGERKKVQYW